MLKQLISIVTLSQSVKKAEFIILQVGTNNVTFRKSSGNIYSFLRLKNTILNTLPSYTIIFSEPTSRTDNVKETLILWHLKEHLRQLNIDIIDSSNIKDVHIGLKGLHLNAKWICRLVINFMHMYVCLGGFENTWMSLQSPVHLIPFSQISQVQSVLKALKF